MISLNASANWPWPMVPRAARKERLQSGRKERVVGHNECADLSAQAAQAVQRFLLEEVAFDPCDEFAIDLDDIGSDERDAVQIRMPHSDVVESEQVG